jgi:D-ribulokinase
VFTGGGAKSRYWSQLRANVLNRPVSLSENAEPALGMAVLAAASGHKVADIAARMVRVRELIAPSQDNARQLSESFLRLLDELSRRGWLSWAVAQHAHRRAGA